MLEVVSRLETTKEEISSNTVPLSFHHSFHRVHENLKKWLDRFPLAVDNSVFNDLFLVYLLASKKFLDHRQAAHLLRLILSTHLMQKKLLRTATFNTHQRHLVIRWIPTQLCFPFSSKPVLGCLIGFNVMDRYELFDEENILLALQKHLPQLRLVKESSYCHATQYKNLKILYFEIEKKNGTSFSLEEQTLLKSDLEEKVKNCIQPLSPTIFMGLNDEELYKNILVLSQEIDTLQVLPQAYITLDQQTGKEIVFRVTLVHISPFHRFSLKERFFDCSFVSQRVLTVRYLEDHPIEAHIFRLHLPRTPSLLRSDGSLDFYSARQKVVALVTSAIGEFRDYNGGILLKQQELLQEFKERFPVIAGRDPELMEAFFYALVPLEKQVVLPQQILSTLFTHFLENSKRKLSKCTPYSFKIHHDNRHTFLTLRGEDASLKEVITGVLQEQSFRSQDMAYNILERAEGFFFNCVLLQEESESTALVQAIQEALNKWHQKTKKQQILRVALEYTIVSLDPRIGGDNFSGGVIRPLFEGLTRLHSNGHVENGVAESIALSANSKEYIFKLRPCLWNDGSPVSAYDFEYAWKKILSPSFKTAFAYFFYPIKNAKEAKEGLVSADEIGVQALNDRTLRVELVRPTPYFLEATAHSLYSPIHRVIDQQHPQWPYQCETHYPCNGPFQLKINQPGQGYQFIKNPYYWDANQVALDQIIFKVMDSSQTIQAFQKGDVDWLGNPYGAFQPSYLAGGEEGRVLSSPNNVVCWCVFNTIMRPFHNRKLRRAFAYAVRRAQLIAGAFLPLQPAYSPLFPNDRASARPLFPECDIEKAHLLFEEALAELGMKKGDFPPLTFIFHEKGLQQYIAPLLSQQFQDCFGIECHLKPLPWNEVFQQMTKGDFQLGLINWTSWVNDPIYTLNAFKSSNQEINFPKWENPDFKQLLHLSDQEANPFQRSSYLLKAEEILSHEVPVIPIYYQPSQALVRNNLQTINTAAHCLPFNVARSCYNTKES